MAVKIDLQQVKAERTGGKTKSSKTEKSALDFLNQDIQLFGMQLSDKKKEAFYSELSLMFSAGIDLRSALNIYAAELPKKKDRELFEGIRNEVENGLLLSEALSGTKRFTAYEFYSVKIGEETGNLSIVLQQLANFYDQRLKQRKQIIGALSYPILVLCTSVAAVVFMLRVVVPMFQDVFKRFGSDLPTITQMVIDISDFVGANSGYGLAFLVIAGALLWIFRKEPKVRDVRSRIALAMPITGDIVRYAVLARFSTAMFMLISSKHPLVGAVALVREMIGFYPIEKSLEKIEKELIEGKTLSSTMAEYSIYPGKMISMIKMAEEVNKLDVIFEKLNEQYTAEVSHRSSLLSSVLEPVLIIFIGILVAIVLISMYLPLFELGTTIG